MVLGNRECMWYIYIYIYIYITSAARNRNLGDAISSYKIGDNDWLENVGGKIFLFLPESTITGLLYQPHMMMSVEQVVEFLGRGNRSTRRKCAPVPLCPPQIPHDRTRARTLASGVGSRRRKLLEQANENKYLGQQDVRMGVVRTGSRSCQAADCGTSVHGETFYWSCSSCRTYGSAAKFLRHKLCNI
jgi:hypothetical protein